MSRKCCYFAPENDSNGRRAVNCLQGGNGLAHVIAHYNYGVVSGLSEGKGAALDPFKALPRNPAQAFHS